MIIYKVLIRAQICFIASPRTPASKMLVTREPVREVSTREKAFFTKEVAAISGSIGLSYWYQEAAVGRGLL